MKIVVRVLIGLVIGAVIGAFGPITFCLVSERLSPGSIGPAATAFAIMTPMTFLIGAGSGAAAWPLLFNAWDEYRAKCKQESEASRQDKN